MISQQNREIGHFYFMQPLKNELPCSDNVLFVFYDFETTQDTMFSENATEHVQNLVCVRQFYSVREMQDDIQIDCELCGKRRHSFFDDPVGNLLFCLCEHRPSCNKVISIAHNAKAFDYQFILRRAVLLTWTPELISTGFKLSV
jgi:hypothetical protein